jgi:diguanylate cyclase (GGDEF)-like protein/PAS domain S-box-containing protein
MLRVGNPGASGGISLGDQGYFKQLFELSPDPTWIIDGNRFVECNEAAIKTLGYASRDELLNIHPSKLSPCRQPDGEDSYAKAERMMAIAKDSGLHRFEWIHTKANGMDFVAEVTLSTLQLLDRQVIYCVWRDITERKQVETALRESHERYSNLVENTADLITSVDAEGRFVFVNKSAQIIFGLAPQECVGLSAFDFVHPEDRRTTQEAFTQWVECPRQALSFENRQVSRSGAIHVMQWSVVARRSSTGEACGFDSVARDFTERKQVEEALRESERQLSESQSIACLGSYVLDIAIGLWKSSEILDRVLGIDATYVRSIAGWEALIHPDDRLMMDSYFKDHVLGQKQIFDRVYRIVRYDDQTPRWVHGIGKLEFDADGGLLKMFGTIQDITERREAENKIQSLAFSDPLTGLPNRRLLLDRLEQAMVGALRHGHQGALLFVDMDDFKTLNDSLGHDMGDQLLQQIAQRVLACVRECDTVARLGGDEFVVLLEDLEKCPREAAKQAEVVGRKIHDALRQPYQLESHGYHSTASIGITLFGGAQRERIEEPLKHAELAMYKAKAVGRDNLRFFEPEMRNAVNARVNLETELHKAVAQAQFLLYYQAQVGRDARLTGTEALVRWQHPERGLISPAEFIPVAEANGLILPLGHWVLETACKQLAAWTLRPEMADLTISVNVSARQFRLPNFVEDVLAILEATGANPKRLKLELTESLLLDNMKDIIAKMTALKASGVGFSLDDFGTGYSSLSYLKRLPLDELKIDQGFVRDILTDPHDAAISKMVVALGEAMGLAVIAEGVESQAQRDTLAALGCYAYQGYLFSKPLPVDAFEILARSQLLPMNFR